MQRRGNKYGARKVTLDGKTFDSAKEARRYAVHLLRARAGEIRNLKCQEKFPLIVNGVKICTYVADFVYEELVAGDWAIVVEDVKSSFTKKLPVYVLKEKLFKALYGLAIHVPE